MTVAAVTMVKDELDILAPVIRHTATQVDFLIVADNASSDGTRELLDELARDLPLTVVDDPEVAYYQSHKITALARLARGAGARWVLPIDADEIWVARDGRRIADVLSDQPEQVVITDAALYDHVATALDDHDEPDPVRRLVWRRPAAAPLPKVAVRALDGLTIHQGNHGASFTGIEHPARVGGRLVVHHYPYRSVAQMARKARNGAAAYAATDLPDDIGGHWRGYGRILEQDGEQGIVGVFQRWFFREHPDQPLVVDGKHQPPLVHDPLPA